MGNFCGSADDATNFKAGMTNAQKLDATQVKDLALKMAKAYIVKYDDNNNGKLNSEESQTMCKEISVTMAEMMIGMMPQEMLDMMGGKEKALAQMKQQAGDAAPKMFGAMDKNGDGEIEEAELAATLEQFFDATKVIKDGDMFGGQVAM